MPRPYYQDDRAGIVLHHGDALEILPTLPDASYGAVISDPVWPNAVESLAGSEDPAGLFAAAAVHFSRLAKRLVVHLGCDSDPRFLAGVPPALPFFRVCWLEYALPSFKGRILYLSDVAYAFGEPPPPRAGQFLIPGRCEADGSTGGKRKGKRRHHPCERLLAHVSWLVKWFGDEDGILDPFAGVGTTLLACKLAGLPCTGIEVNEQFCEAAARRLESVAPSMFCEAGKVSDGEAPPDLFARAAAPEEPTA